MPTWEQERSSDWVVAIDTGGRFSCSTRGELGYIREAGRVEVSTIGRVSVIEDGEEIEVFDIEEVIKGMEEVGRKSG